jgi:hypothetical protein
VQPYVDRIKEMRHYDVKAAGPRQDQNEMTQS